MIQAHYDSGVAQVRRTEDVHRLLDRLVVARNAALVHSDCEHTAWVGVRGDRGAILFADAMTGSWASLGEGPRMGPRYAGLRFPSHCEIPVTELAVAIDEFLTTGQRPTLVPWQRVR
ncbi:hypothetical protein JOF41_003327 [Saccharothrix coeruleofusca]|uniref:Imm1 family immunity protein n=1 Tax=Saccharothrix coeruleofusca TaxID=33919 RepID=UPI001AE8D9CD|nr:Imm1 family immunity protein [Saccharothrix coeruleofusca]MBP2337149.1 hypothetical protein [Saccharothrix coeruleofusca]